MNAFLWWRSWHGAPMDTKWPVIAARSGVKTGIVSAIAWALFDYASQQKVRGTVEGFDTEIYAVYSGFTEEEITAVIQAMMDKGIIVNGKLANWDKRQPKREDDSTERVRQYRDKKRSVTQCNAKTKSVTIDSVSVSLSDSVNTKEELNTESLNTEAHDDESEISALSKQFEASANMGAHNLEKWNNALVEMHNAGARPEDIAHVVHLMKCPPKGQKKLTVAGPWSCTNMVIAHISDRKAGSLGIDRSQYEQ